MFLSFLLAFFFYFLLSFLLFRVLLIGELRIFLFPVFFGEHVTYLSPFREGLGKLGFSWGSVRVGRWDARRFLGSQHIIKGWPREREVYVVAPTTILLTTASLSLSLSLYSFSPHSPFPSSRYFHSIFYVHFETESIKNAKLYNVIKNNFFKW